MSRFSRTRLWRSPCSSDNDIDQGCSQVVGLNYPVREQSVKSAADRAHKPVAETEARERMRGRDENDWPVLATALGLGCDIWTEDQDFFGTGIAIWTTNRIEIFLKSQKLKMEAGSRQDGTTPRHR
jgi:hypothetical protein